jgi:hypothetical protein
VNDWRQFEEPRKHNEANGRHQGSPARTTLMDDVQHALADMGNDYLEQAKKLKRA